MKTVVNGVFMVLPIGLVGVAVLPSFLTSYAATKVAVAGVAAAETVVAACGGDCKDEVDSARMTVERIVPRGTSVAQVIEYMKMRTFQTGNEYGLVRLTSGERAIVSGNELSINLSENVERLIAHTHGYQYGPTGPSSLDIDALRKLGQFSSYLIERGDVTRFFVKPTK